MLADAKSEPWVSPVARSAKEAMCGQTIADYGKQCIARRVIKTSTRPLYLDLFTKHIKPALGEIGMGQLTQDYVTVGTQSFCRIAQLGGLTLTDC
jgi:hypothetical protein